MRFTFPRAAGKGQARIEAACRFAVPPATCYPTPNALSRSAPSTTTSPTFKNYVPRKPQTAFEISVGTAPACRKPVDLW